MKIEPLDLSHKLLLEEKFRDLNLSLSEYCFANLYLFRKIHQYQVIKNNAEVYIKGITRDNVPFIMLTSIPQNSSLESLQSVLENKEVLFPIPESWLPYFENIPFQGYFKEEDSDYLYAASKLAHFPGRHLNGQRNLVKQLTHQHIIKGENIENHLKEAQTVLEKWQGERKEETDFESCQEALQKFKTLQLEGRIIFVDQQAAGFTIGTRLTKECYVLLFSKGLHAIKGLNQYLYEDIAQIVEGTYKWINLEQDLNIAALRKAKHSYLPDALLRKWRLMPNIINKA